MSSSGINSINSGPLIIRTYLGNSVNNTYILGNYDIPAQANQVLTISTGGLLVPSNNFTISSVTFSTITTQDIFTSTITASTITTQDIFTSTITASTIISEIINVSTINVSSIFVDDGYISSLEVSTINGFPFPSGDDSFWSGNLAGNIHNDNAGFVGIGTNNPQALLHVAETSPNSHQEFQTPGSYTVTIPANATEMEFEMIGAGGPANQGIIGLGGTGGYIKGKINVTSFQGQNITIVVGALGNVPPPPGSITQSGATYIYKSGTTLFAMCGAGGGSSRTGITQNGGYGGGGTFTNVSGSDWVAAGGPGDGGGGSTGGGGGQNTAGGTAGNCDGSFPGVTGNDRNPPTVAYEEALGGNNSQTVPGGNGYTGGGSGCAGGGGSSYYNFTYTNIITSYPGNTLPANLVQGYGRNQQSGYVYIAFPSSEPAIVTNGSVGIGTTEPVTLLDVRGGIQTNLFVSTPILSMPNSQGQLFGVSTINGFKYDPTDDALWSANGNNIYNDNSGNVGIGTATPQFKFDVLGTVPSNGSARITQSITDILTADPALGIRNNTTGTPRIINFFTNLNASNYNPICAANDKAIVFSDSGADSGNMWIGPWSSSPAGIKILTNGNIGIGLSNPQQALDVNGNLILRPPAALYTVTNHGVGAIKCEVAVTATSGSGTKLHFVDYGFTTNPTLTVDTSNTIVGIRQVSPVYPLDVTGRTRIDFGGTLHIGSTMVSQGSAITWNQVQVGPGLTEFVSGTGTGGDGGFDFFTAVADNTSATAANFAMRIAGNKNVGIGTTSPSQKLHVAGSIKVDNGIYDSNNSAGTSGQVLTAGNGTGQVVWGSPLAPLASGIATFATPSVTQTITLGFTITANADIQITWYNDNAGTTQNPIYVLTGNNYTKQVWWNPVGSYPTTQFAIQIGPSAAGDGPNPAQTNHLIKWAVYRT